MIAQARERRNSGSHVKKKIVLGSLKVLVPLYLTYIIFLLSVFLLFIPHQKKQLLNQKKLSIRHLTDSTVSLLAEYEQRVQRGEISPETARHDAKNQIRQLRYGPDGKDYFWISDFHPFMIMHPYRPELESRDLTEFRDTVGNHPFMAMVETVLGRQAGYVNYHWQWKDTPGESQPKISYVRGFPAWQWIVGTGVYENDILEEIRLITRQFFRIFIGIFIFIVLLSLYITTQVIKTEKMKNMAQTAQRLEELRLKKLLELNRLAGKSSAVITEFALKEAIKLSQSQIGYLAFMDKDESRLTMHNWSEQTMKQCKIKDKKLVYHVADTGLWASAARTRKPVVINDYQSHSTPEKKGYPASQVKIERVLNVPIFDGDKIVALAGVGNKKEPYNDSDIRQLQLMMEGMWKILQKSQGEIQLKKSEKRYRLLADNATDGIWIMDLPTMKFSYASPAMANLYGYDPQELMDMKMGKHMTKNSMEKAERAISEELARDGAPNVDPERHQVLELEIFKPDGEKIWVEIKASFLRDSKGQPNRILGITRDISQRKALEHRLRQTQKMEALGTLAGGIAHDFNNILSSIIGFTELAKRKTDKNSDIYSKLENILAGGLRARDLVKHILIFSRKSDVIKRIIPITPLVKECLRFMKASLGPGIEIRRHVHYRDGLILADSTQMHQILMNLFTNAAYAMKEGGGILDVELASVTLSPDDLPMAGDIPPGPYVQIIVKDTGMGIPKELTEKIFEPFFTTKARGEGAGMGLSMVYGIIKEMNGTISVSSEPGRGACFTILIPDRINRDKEHSPASHPQPVTGKGNILLVDDEPDIIEWSSQFLLKLGYRVQGFENGPDALECFRQAPLEFDLVVTDLSMPGMTGLELAKRILAERQDLPIVLCTGFSENLTRERIWELGLTDMVIKPMIAGELSQVVKRALTDKKEKQHP